MEELLIKALKEQFRFGLNGFSLEELWRMDIDSLERILEYHKEEKGRLNFSDKGFSEHGERISLVERVIEDKIKEASKIKLVGLLEKSKRELEYELEDLVGLIK